VHIRTLAMTSRANPPDDARDLLRTMILIRAFEEHVLTLPQPGFQLLSTGEEAVAAGTCAPLEPGDQLLTGGRAIGPALARGVTAEALLAELLGKQTGPCKGKAGRGHFSQPEAGFFGAHAVVGGNLSVAAGVALAQQQTGTGRVVVCMFGDGACGEGVLHETLNMAALWKLPLIFLCNNNQYSISTRVQDAIAVENLADLARPFRMPAVTVDGMDVLAVRDAVARAVAHARGGQGPSFVECVSYRFHQHSTSSKESRPREEIERWRTRCPITTFAARFGLDTAPIRAEVDQEIAAAAGLADAAPFPDPSALFDDLGA
jgi:TPP-dependent pyruvate/acetoin dehydrogenase alpha subunit